jgi:hypothetical protein
MSTLRVRPPDGHTEDNPAILVSSTPIGVFTSALAQSQTTGGIAGTIKDKNGSVIVGAEVTVIGNATASERKSSLIRKVTMLLPLLPPGIYQMRVVAGDLEPFLYTVQVVVTESRVVNFVLGGIHARPC